MSNYAIKFFFSLFLCSLDFLFSCKSEKERLGTAQTDQEYGHKQSVTSPAWVPNTIIYETFVRAFSQEGTFQKVTERLPELRDLGVETIWLMPIHPLGKRGRKGTLGSPYSVRDHFAINPEFGPEDDLRRLVNTAHQLGLRVILDWVANHAANDHVEMENHPDWFARDKNGNFTREVADWWDVTDFNYENPEMRRYMKRAMLHWVKGFDIDGYRCDVAGMVPEDFWADVRAELRKIKPDIFLLAEGEEPRLHLNQFDATYDWSLYHKLKEICRGKTKAEEVIDLILEKEKQYPQGALRLRFLENHDEQRAAKMFGRPGYKPYATFIFTTPGLPMLYAGQEVADTVKPTLFDKVEVNWDGTDPTVREFYKRLIWLRKENSVFVDGETIKIQTNRPAEIVAFARVENERVAVVALNLSIKRVKAILQFPESLRKSKESIDFARDGEGPVQLFLKPSHQIMLAPFESAVYLSR